LMSFFILCLSHSVAGSTGWGPYRRPAPRVNQAVVVGRPAAGVAGSNSGEGGPP
jgi:hypothetical protein